MRIGAIATSYVAPEELYLSVIPRLLLYFCCHIWSNEMSTIQLLLSHVFFNFVSSSDYSVRSYKQVPVQSCVMDRVSAQRSPPLAKLLEKARQAPDPDFFALLFHLLYEQQVRILFSFTLWPIGRYNVSRKLFLPNEFFLFFYFLFFFEIITNCLSVVFFSTDFAGKERVLAVFGTYSRFGRNQAPHFLFCTRTSAATGKCRAKRSGGLSGWRGYFFLVTCSVWRIPS